MFPTLYCSLLLPDDDDDGGDNNDDELFVIHVLYIWFHLKLFLNCFKYVLRKISYRKRLSYFKDITSLPVLIKGKRNQT